MSENLVRKAEEYAKTYYKDITRKNGENFYGHARRVKENLETIGINDETILTAALLHGLPQVTNLTIDDIRIEFGEDVAFLVEGLLQISKTPLPIENREKNVSVIHKLIIQLSKDMRVLLIRLADRVDNIKTTEGFSPKEKEWIAQNAKLIFAPIAKAVGIYYFTREFEDNALKILQPERYRQIVKFQKHKYENIQREMILTKHKISQFLKENEIENFEISFREKGIYSTHQKALYKASKGDIKNPDDFDGLYDLLGIRILVPNKDDCYKVLAFIQSVWENVQSEFDDYIARPKPNGYQSLQTAIKISPNHFCEVQIRTFEMQSQNEYGPASHFSYKYGKQGVKDSVSWIRDLISMKDDIQNSLSTSSKINLFEDTIFAFTPKGDLITLPHDSCVLDFAYAIHDAIGNACSGAKLNGKLVALNSIIKSGDTVEIITTKGKKPSRDWLEYVKTHEAKKEIRKFLA